jgi:hypothetical protein
VYGKLEQPARSAKAQPAVLLAQFDDPQVGGRGKTTVEADLLGAEETPPFESGEVEETEIERFLQLVDVAVGQVDARDVGLTELHATGCFWVAGRVKQLLVHVQLIHAVPFLKGACAYKLADCRGL